MPRRKDAPANDPHVKALGGFDVCAMAPAELKRKKITTGKPFTAEAGQAWLMHSEYLSSKPEHDLVDRAYARCLAHQHMKRHGKLAGLRLLRPFPCAGTFRVALDSGAGPVLVVCDACGEELGVPWERESDGGLGPVRAQQEAGSDDEKDWLDD